MFIIGNFNNEITVTEYKMDKNQEDRDTSKKEHEKDEAIEEYVGSDPQDKAPDREESDQEGMGISKKAKRQSSDEGDVAHRRN